MIIFIDFDHTIFETRGLLKQMAREFVEFGIPVEDFWASYRELRKQHPYSFKTQRRYLKRMGQDFPLKLEQKLKKVIGTKARKQVYADALFFLSEIRKNKKIRLILLSFGDRQFQLLKIRGAGLERYFDRIVITPKIDKTKKAQAHFKKGKEIYLIDDHPLVLKKFFGFDKINLIQIVRGRKAGSKAARVRVFKNFYQIFNFFKGRKVSDPN